MTFLGLTLYGLAYGYFPKASKTYNIVMKPECRVEIERLFEDTGVQSTGDGEDLVHKAGQYHLGAAVDSAEFISTYLNEKVVAWTEQVILLADVAATQPYDINGPSYSTQCQQQMITCSH